MAWASGERLQGGKYIVEKELGLGGFGITYLVRNTQRQLFVVKTLNDKVQHRPNFAKCQQDFLNEALRLARCSHPHIVRVEEVIQEGELWCMVMEYIHGETLASRIDQYGALSEPEALRYIQQIGEALTVVHNNGLLHRDVKPINIMLRSIPGVASSSLEAVLIDFGIAREFTPNLTQTHTEQFSGGFSPIEQYDRRSKRGAYTDVYALAATLYTLLTGEVPRLAPIRATGIALDPPKEINPAISDKVHQAILKGMELKPENRPQSVQEWLALMDIKVSPVQNVIKPAPVLLASQTSASLSHLVTETIHIINVPLISAVGVDYTNLRNLLAARKWKEADQETAKKMCEVAGREKEGYLRDEDIKSFFLEDLKTINSLWVEYSKGRFGLTVQNRIWDSVNRDPNKFAARVGWTVNGEWVSYYDLKFDLNAPPGHLPFWWSLGCEIGKWWRCWHTIFSRKDLLAGEKGNSENPSPKGKFSDRVWRVW